LLNYLWPDFDMALLYTLPHLDSIGKNKIL